MHCRWQFLAPGERSRYMQALTANSDQDSTKFGSSALDSMQTVQPKLLQYYARSDPLLKTHTSS
jgi:hypothetical protein